MFFPTGGGKTEAYLGLAAFVIAYRRLTSPGLLGAGVAVIMRYTLRLLTLDQLARAAGVVCALELMRSDLALDSMYAQFFVHHSHRIASHFAGADRVIFSPLPCADTAFVE